MSESREEIRCILKFYYKKGKNATQAAKKICDIYGSQTISVRAAQTWFKRFQSNHFDVKDAPRSGRPITNKVDEIIEIVEQDRYSSSHDIGKELRIDHKTVLKYLEKAGYKKQYDAWMPRDLTAKNLLDRILICESLLKRNEIEPFLKRLVTGDEKWITYDNNVRVSSKKAMLCVWWDWLGILHYELLPAGLKIDSNFHCEQLERLHQAIERERPELISKKGIIFHYANVRQNTFFATRQKIKELDWEILIHPPHSPDLSPSNYHLFQSLQNSLSEVKLASIQDCENHLLQFFGQKSQKFYSDGIMVLPEKWQKVIEQNGTYLV